MQLFDNSPFSSTATSSGIHYSVVPNPGLSFSLAPISPSASGGPSDADGGVFYQAAAAPVTVNLKGVTPDPDDPSNLNILIGQNCQASLACALPGVTVDLKNPQWSAEGNTFKDYVVYGPDKYNVAWSKVDWMQSADWNVASPTWAWMSESGAGTPGVIDSDEQITGSADLWVNGQYVTRIQGIQDVLVWEPYYSCSHTVGGSYIFNNGSSLWLGTNYPDVPGISWFGQVIPEDLFNPPCAGNGQWDFVQTVSRWWQITTDDLVVHDWIWDGQTGLDTTYPYGFDDDEAFEPDDHSYHGANDNPTVPLNDSMAAVRVADSFDVYMMYRPANLGFGCQRVPLHNIGWGWNAAVVRPGTSWSQETGPFPMPFGSVSVNYDQRWTEDPIWTQLILANNNTWYPSLP